MERASPEELEQTGRRGRLRRKDRQLVGALGLCRYLTIQQVMELGVGARTEKSTGYRLRGLAGEETKSKVRASRPALLRRFPFRSFEGEQLHLWALTPAGYRVAGVELGLTLQVPRTDIGAQFAEHFVQLTDLLVHLLRAHLSSGSSLRDLPFRWDVVADVDLPWRETDTAGESRTRVLRPDAVLTLPEAKRRLFIECETGSNTLVAEGPRRRQAVVNKLDRYDTFVSGFADVASHQTHYQRRYPDRWPCEVLLLVRTERRQRNTESAISAFLSSRPEVRFAARAFLLSQAVTHVSGLLGSPKSPAARSGAPSPSFYGEPEHQAVKDFVLEMSAALSRANAALRRRRLPPVADPDSGRHMVHFLRRAQVEMTRRRVEEQRDRP